MSLSLMGKPEFQEAVDNRDLDYLNQQFHIHIIEEPEWFSGMRLKLASKDKGSELVIKSRDLFLFRSKYLEAGLLVRKVSREAVLL